MRFHIVALLLTPIFRGCSSLTFGRPDSATLESVGFQVESDSLPNDSLAQLGPHDEVSASGDQEIPSSSGNDEADGCRSNAKNNGSKNKKRGGSSCPAVYDIQEIQVEECTPAQKLCPSFLEPLCCTGTKRNNGFPSEFDVGSCISCM